MITSHVTLSFHISTEIPQPPELTEITQLGTSDTNNSESVLYHIQWAQPSNVEAFDLDHYELIVGNHTMNIDAKENAVIFPLIMKKEIIMVAYIMAVDRCGKKSNRGSRTIYGSALSIANGLDSTSVISCTCVIEVVTSVIVTLIATLMAVAVVIITRVLVIKFKSTSSPPERHHTALTTGNENSNSDRFIML